MSDLLDETGSSSGITADDLDVMQDEVLALLRAWEDRGVEPQDGVTVLCGIAHAALAHFGVSLADLVQTASMQWTRHGGNP